MTTSQTGVISADAIEHLDPFLGQTAQSIGSTSSRSAYVHSTRVKRLMPSPGGKASLWLTSAPLLLADLVTIVTAFLSVAIFFSLVGFSVPVSAMKQAVGVLLCFVGVASFFGLYHGTAMSPVLEVRQLVRSCLIASMMMLLLGQLFGTLRLTEIAYVVSTGLVASCSLPLIRGFARYRLGRCRWWGERALIIGAGSQGKAIYDFYHNSPSRGLKPIGLVDFPDSPYEEDENERFVHRVHLGSIRRVGHLARRHRLRWAIVAPAGCDSYDISEAMKLSGQIPNLVFLPSQNFLPSLWSSSRECAGILGVHVTDYLHNPFAKALKRAIDLTVSTLTLILFLPFLLAMMLLIKRISPGPAFFGHERIGLNGKTFKAWKLRTMVVNASEVLEKHLEEDPEARMQWMEDQKLKNDPRIIPTIGNLLRRTSLDELPQLYNVLRGDMSLVGPRPIVRGEVEKYGDMYPMYLRVLPGITGLWQISGRNDTTYDHRVRLDSYYVRNWSIWLDAYIAVRTIRTIVMREGAY